MKYAAEMGSGAMIYVSSFVTIGIGTQKLIRGIYRHTGRRLLKPAFGK
jgi:hypothetical protein